MPPGVSRLAASFAAAPGETGLIPYLTAGYPSPEATREMMAALASARIRALELGIPFSDPIADGPDIQRASEGALRAGVGVAETLEMVAWLRERSACPLVLMTYLNPLLCFGIEPFAQAAREAGADGVLVSDLPPDEAPEIWAALDRGGLDTIVLVAPSTGEGRLPLLLARARGFVYCLARTGVTGGGDGDAVATPEGVAELRRRSGLPVAVGFGIGDAAGARVWRGSADAVVVGAAFMRRVTEDPTRGAAGRVRSLADELIAALG